MPKISDTFYKYSLFVIIVSIFAGFFLPYFNFSDAMYHYSFMRKILTEERFINHSPFYGEKFYDIRYSYSFVIPLYSFFANVLNNFFSLNSSIRHVWNSSHIFIYILSLISWFYCIKLYFGKNSARMSIYVFTVLFFGISSDLFNGQAFSLSIYPFSFVLFVFLPNLLMILKKNIHFYIVVCSFIISGIHVFYSVLFFFHVFVFSVYKKNIKLMFYYIAGIIPVFVLKFMEFDLSNDFFKKTTSVSYDFLLKHSMNGVSGYINVLLLFTFIIFYKIFYKRKFVFYLYILSMLAIIITPVFSNFITLNSQKLLRIYQIIPPVFYFSPVFLIFYRKFKKALICVFIFMFFILLLNLGIKGNKSTLNQALVIEKILLDANIEGKILSDPAFSMLITSFTQCYAVSVPVEYSAPSVTDIKLRQKAYEHFIFTGELLFDCDYVLILPEHKIFAERFKNSKNIGRDFYVVDVRENTK